MIINSIYYGLHVVNKNVYKRIKKKDKSDGHAALFRTLEYAERYATFLPLSLDCGSLNYLAVVTTANFKSILALLPCNSKD